MQHDLQGWRSQEVPLWSIKAAEQELPDGTEGDCFNSFLIFFLKKRVPQENLCDPFVLSFTFFYSSSIQWSVLFLGWGLRNDIYCVEEDGREWGRPEVPI